MSKRIALLAVALVFAGACGSPTPSTRPQVPADGEALRIVHYSWLGVSPGAGFTHTSVRIEEADLGAGTIRRLARSADEPEPMLAGGLKAQREALAAIAPTPLSATDAKTLHELAAAWLATDPPSEYHRYRGLGREDGYSERLVVSWSDGTRSVSLNPRKGFSPEDPLWPPDEFFALVEALEPPPGTIEPG